MAGGSATSSDLVYPIVNNLRTSVGVLAFYAMHADWVIRHAVAYHPHIPFAVVQQLMLDDNNFVRDQAKWQYFMQKRAQRSSRKP